MNIIEEWNNILKAWCRNSTTELCYGLCSKKGWTCSHLILIHEDDADIIKAKADDELYKLELEAILENRAETII